MDKVISARIDESSADKIGYLARHLNRSRKYVLEEAISMYAAHIDHADATDVFEETRGTWQRDESAEELLATSRKAFRENLRRHQK